MNELLQISWIDCKTNCPYEKGIKSAKEQADDAVRCSICLDCRALQIAALKAENKGYITAIKSKDYAIFDLRKQIAALEAESKDLHVMFDKEHDLNIQQKKQIAALKAENAVEVVAKNGVLEKLQKAQADIQRLEGEFVRATTRKPGSKIPPLPESKE